ncbi:hypothetical protein HDU87_001498 [Geranomyces variabilis]|uniref:Uncharacterized protein n=1 Tax=Geranomyces variabilis TaxID=109894 RepID=A0AAD5TDG8_9FUNG|nr:hypothetical protein HDU87_001498 [Geranomyces variabilis]
MLPCSDPATLAQSGTENEGSLTWATATFIKDLVEEYPFLRAETLRPIPSEYDLLLFLDDDRILKPADHAWNLTALYHHACSIITTNPCIGSAYKDRAKAALQLELEKVRQVSEIVTIEIMLLNPGLVTLRTYKRQDDEARVSELLATYK